MSDAHWTEVYELWTHIDSVQTIDVRDVWPEFADAMDRVVEHCVTGDVQREWPVLDSADSPLHTTVPQPDEADQGPNMPIGGEKSNDR